MHTVTKNNNPIQTVKIHRKHGRIPNYIQLLVRYNEQEARARANIISPLIRSLHNKCDTIKKALFFSLLSKRVYAHAIATRDRHSRFSQRDLR